MHYQFSIITSSTATTIKTKYLLLYYLELNNAITTLITVTYFNKSLGY